MPAIIDPETLPVDPLPTIWSPVQSVLHEHERAQELEAQATASLLWASDVPEAILRLLLGETAIARAFDPPDGYDAARQGEWDPDLVTFKFARPIRLLHLDRQPDHLTLEYRLEGAGAWRLDIDPEALTLARV